ncbi:hypothetical protein ABZU75_08100 [Streptosporangium sp. NPDC005286]|uniref:hypothetical protein n=1 Tax=Streptosporangium sp. NPDC005286 TaxID=3154463 RepID=UPI0033B2A0BE
MFPQRFKPAVHFHRWRLLVVSRLNPALGSLNRRSQRTGRSDRRARPDHELAGLAAGFHAVARLPEGADEAEIVDAAAQRSVGLQGLGRYRSPGIVFGFGDVNEDAIRHGIAAIGDLLRQG